MDPIQAVYKNLHSGGFSNRVVNVMFDCEKSTSQNK